MTNQPYTPVSPVVLFAIGSPESQKLVRAIDLLVDECGGYENVRGDALHEVFSNHFAIALKDAYERGRAESH